jgi:hypothetical protein
MPNAELFEHAETLQHLLVSEATGGNEDASDYGRLRMGLLAEPSLEYVIPRFVRTCRSTGQFWQFIKNKYGTYAERRQYIWDEFRPLLDHLENPNRGPADTLVTGVLEKFDAEHVGGAWKKALERRTTDAEGAITSARTLLESVCKHILDEEDITYNDKDDLPRLYRLTSEKLKIAPSQHTEEVFSRFLGVALP